jgi:hypothetical protein
MKITNNLELVSIDDKFRIKDDKMNVNEPKLNKNNQKYELPKRRV